jgi:hypothetical protein
MGGAITGRGVDLPEPYGIPPNPKIREWARTWYLTVQQLVEDGRLRPCPFEIIPGRFDGIMTGLELLRKGKVSGRKLIVKLAEDES